MNESINQSIKSEFLTQLK